MRFIEVPLKDLTVNPENDRHGAVGSEQDAIAWLFQHEGPKMLTLAQDIAQQGQIYDAPLILKRENKNIVFDGNRRITCLKILAGLIPPPTKYRKKLDPLVKQTEISKTLLITCQIETSQKTVDEIVSRRHNGTDGGRGQLKWDTRAKGNHANRVGATNQYPIAEAVENYLIEVGYPHARKVGRSTIFRLINAKKRQKQIGISLNDDGSLKLLRDEKSVVSTLTTIADDIVDKKLSLKHLLDSKGVEGYMKKLADAGLTSDDSPPEDSTPSGKPSTTASGPKRPPSRNTLIRDIDYEIQWRPSQGKIEQTWTELQWNLRFNRNEIAIPIVFRILLELSLDFAISKRSSPKSPTLSSKTKHIAKAFLDEGEIDRKTFGDIERVCGDTKSPREIEALNRVVHSSSFTMAKEDLISLWNNTEKLIVLAITK